MVEDLVIVREEYKSRYRILYKFFLLEKLKSMYKLLFHFEIPIGFMWMLFRKLFHFFR